MKFESFNFTLSEHFLVYLEYGDTSNLTDDEETQFIDWLDIQWHDAKTQYPNALGYHWSIGDDAGFINLLNLIKRKNIMIDKYLENEFYQCCPLFPTECGTIKMQVKSERGKTRWFNITHQQFKDIENVLAYGYKVIDTEN